MRIAIDLQGAQSESRFRGIGRYSRSLVQAIIKNRGEHEIFIALNGLLADTIEPIRTAFDGLLPQESIRVWNAPAPIRECLTGNTLRREAAERIREAFLAGLEPDVVLITSLFEGFEDDAAASIGEFDKTTPTAVILYDLIPLLNPNEYLHTYPAYREHYFRKVEHLKRASAWLAISGSCANEAAEALNLRKDHLFDIAAACEEWFRPVDIPIDLKAQLLQKYGISKPFLMYSGGADFRKNLPRLICAYSKLAPDLRKSHQLIFTGNLLEGHIQILRRASRSAGLGDDELVFTGYVTDEDLVSLYSLCELFVFPSWHEGFGLPLLEAMSCKAPAIAAAASSMPEVIGRDDALFDPFSEDAIAAKIAEVLQNDAFRKDLIRHGFLQSKKYSWEESARKSIRALEQIYAERHSSAKIASSPPARRRLAYFSPLPPERSGISDYSAKLLPELASHYDIEAISTISEGSDPWIQKNLPVRSVEYFVKNHKQYERILYHIGNSPFHQHMFQLVDRYPGVVVLHDFFLGNVRAYLEHLMPCTWPQQLYNSHGYGAILERYHSTNLTDVVFKYPCNFDILQRALGVIVHSRYSIGLAKEWYCLGGDWSVIPLLRAASDSPDKTAARRKLGIPLNSFIVCSFGMLNPVKLNHRLLNAWMSSDLSHDPRCRLFFVGENHGGDYGQSLIDTINKSHSNDRICITGWADADNFRSYLIAADVAVQLRALSRGETSAAVLDCMNHALPTIVNANGSLAELPNDAVYLLSDEFKDSDLIEALERLWWNSEFRLALGKKAKEVISTKHSPRICAEMYAESIEKFYGRAETSVEALVESLARLDNISTNPEAILPFASSISQCITLKHPARQILVDVSAIVNDDLKTGVQRVTRSILKEMLLNPPSGYRIEPVYATLDIPGYRYARDFTMRFLDFPGLQMEDEPIEFQPGDVFVGLDLHQYAIPSQVEYLRSMRDQSVHIFFVVYDLLPLQMPEMFPSGTEDVHSKWLETIYGVAEGIISISKCTANAFAEWANKKTQKRLRPLGIGWFHLAADLDNSQPTKGFPNNAPEVLARISARKTLLMVGTIEPRKGYLQAIAAMDQLWLSGLDVNLVIVGNEGWKHLPDDMRRTIPQIVKALRNHPELGRRLFWLESISDEYLERIYDFSSCLLAASEGEGFGLPLIEAAQHRLPVIARDIPVFREVAGEFAFYFTGSEPNKLAEAIRQWLDRFAQGMHPRSTEIQRLTWKQSTQQLLKYLLNSPLSESRL